MFSPYSALARRLRGAAADPLAHCAINVALYRDGRPLWSMTERAGAAVQRTAERLQVGRSALHWDAQGLTVDIDEWSAPLPQRLRGRLRLRPRQRQAAPLVLDSAGRHHWWPIAPQADVEVDFDQPGWRWRGRGYFDSNRGSEPLEQAFQHWHWARAQLDDQRSAVVYDTLQSDGRRTAMAWLLQADAAPEHLAGLSLLDLPAGAWGVPRQVSADSDREPRLLRRLEDGPFYTRSLLALSWQGRPVRAVHESLSLRRFARPWVQAMLPFRMPRRG